MDILWVIVKTCNKIISLDLFSTYTQYQIILPLFEWNLWLKAYQIYHPMCFKNVWFDLFLDVYCFALNWATMAPCRRLYA